MMSNESGSVTTRLRQGIDAARAGRGQEAREHLIAVLKQDPQNIPALLWLAFVSPSAQDTIRLLKRVLVLDPENERAEAGLRWAKARLEVEPDQPEADQTTAASVEAEEDEAVNETSIRQQLLSDQIQKQAKKGALAQRARRNINPLLVIVFVTGAVGLISIALGALIFVPTETLAAWLPAAIERVANGAEMLKVEPMGPVVPPAAASSRPATKSFTSQADTLALTGPPLLESRLSLADLAGPSPQAVPSAETAAPVAPAETNPASLEPAALIGPELAPPVAESQVPAENPLLVHQPAYPGEKWIEVNVTTQQVTAWEGDRPVFSFIVSTGLPNTPTILGEFHIYWKLESALMIGPNYYLPEVPYTMYFYRGYALHGTYWHHNFGQPMSHGCVNLETGEAKKLFEWADPVLPAGQTETVATADNPGTLVIVHE